MLLCDFVEYFLFKRYYAHTVKSLYNKSLTHYFHHIENFVNENFYNEIA